MLTEEDKNRARGHMGYLEVQEASTFVLGIPAGTQTQFVIERAFTKILPQSEERFRGYLDQLDALECQITENSGNVEASKIGDIELNPKAFQGVIMRYRYWQGKLSNMLGVPPNPFDARPYLGQGYNGGGYINSPVSG